MQTSIFDRVLNFFTDYSSEVQQKITSVKNDIVYHVGAGDDSVDIPDIILKSWEKSKLNGLTPATKLPYINNSEPFETDSDIDEVIKNTFVEIYKYHMPTPYIFDNIKPYFYIANSQGIIMAEYGLKDDIEFFHNINVGVNADISFEAIGTSAHSIAMRKQKVAQLSGAQCYLDVFKDVVMTSAPIIVNGVSIATTGVFVRHSFDVILYDSNKRFNNLSTRALTIENAIKMHQELASNELIKQTISQNTKDVASSHGIITIDEQYNIAYICNIAKKVVSFDNNNNLKNYMPDIHKTISYITHDVSSKYTNRHTVSLSDKSQVQAVIKSLSDSDGKLIGYTLFLLEPDRQNKHSMNTMIGEHSSLNLLKKHIVSTAHAKHNVLILGESGTGKEKVAQAIHELSGAKGNFVAINCASIPANLIESELFGYVEGAFTGALKSGSMGKIEYANNGTLFLDEIGDMPLALQPVLLRVLEERQVVRIGGKKSTAVNIRVIAATNVNLYEKVLAKEFRQDLYFRLSVINFSVPPLRERGTDIIRLANYFIERERSICGHQVSLSQDVEALFLTYSWPGNIRQLENAIISALYLLDGSNTIELEHLPPLIRQEQVKVLTDGPLAELMEETILQALKQCGDNYAKAARMLNISRTTLYRKMKKMGTRG